MNYLLDLGLTKEEIDNLKPNIAEALELFPYWGYYLDYGYFMKKAL